jgi:phasin
MSVMTEARNAKTGNPAASEAFHEIADKGIAHTKDSFKNAKAVAEEATHLFQHNFTAAAKGATDYNLKVIEIARINTNAAFDYAHELLGVKSLSDFVEVSSASARRQFETMTAQTKELTALAQKISEPLKTGITGAFNKVA